VDTIIAAIARCDVLATENDFNGRVYRRVIDAGDGPNHYEIAADRYRRNAEILRRFLARIAA
jgi:hypothetical protein